MYSGVVSFSSSQGKVFWSHTSLKVSSKTLVLVMRLVPQKSKNNLLLKTVIPSEILNQKCLPRNSCSKAFARFHVIVSGGVHLPKSCKNEVINFTENRLRLVVPLGILKIFKTAYSRKLTAKYFHYYTMPPFLLISNKMF